jgi:hypothetical protein
LFSIGDAKALMLLISFVQSFAVELTFFLVYLKDFLKPPEVLRTVQGWFRNEGLKAVSP